MCGIVGISGTRDTAPLIVDALRRLEYRGYDSAGVATLVDGRIERRRSPGKLSQLDKVLHERPLPGHTGIGHTRWATHGAPTETNAHPHASARVAIVHNGIIENFRELRAELIGKGHKFESETDSEVCAHLVTDYLNRGLSPKDAALEATRQLTGAFSLAMLFAGHEHLLVGARKGAPLAVGFGDNEGYLGSDAFALAPFTNRVSYLEDGDVVVVDGPDIAIYDSEGRPANREVRITSASAGLVDKGGYRHFMLKEIHEQPEVIGHTLAHYIDPAKLAIKLPESDAVRALASATRLTISACGTAFYAGLIGKYWFERFARLAVEADVASELRYRDPVYPEKGAALFISQSGETADTLAALRDAKAQGQTTLAVVNVPESSIAREADVVLPTFAGPEIGVASTKAFTCQLTVLAALAIAAGKARGHLDAAQEQGLLTALLEAPRQIVDFLRQEPKIEALGAEMAKARDVLYLGRGVNFPLAMEGALKLKEISYIHAEGYAAGEMKHGPIALIDENVPVIVLAPHDAVFEKTVSNMQEVMARGGKVVLISDARGIDAAGDGAWATIQVPECHPLIAPLVYAVPVQLLAYHMALAKGTDVDQPRNLAKSVTVE
ncbi:MAG: glutamine--fructose-6-phosphate transaminase (isomerizing) [Alphaproteobacteria bacterium]|nr:glutamine--fructose-6-phosphate transaminase (isomerizing) [Alphaproteobacteria bacterium]MBU6472400.1 glutamine--fructose-6-phosphate transaminase (isomerizing) [Alphaproteobacteria bacterium]MDE2014026.1 glutamine--fructose-6-phosphate transaminase (isomerizing) [Alphaproteobacteria bacterium]MDE2074527.1 glutamine--fructose-6-phosphate transaminase (isomerizing) [Alphaproteobacteria bacterium]MDE2353247.1 glutamine--fructose-6-phosphate transaminase (isomerizing) [Alphaproteobacteria bact